MTCTKKIFVLCLISFVALPVGAASSKTPEITIEGSIVALPGTARPLSLYMNAVETPNIPDAVRVDIAANVIPDLKLGDIVRASGKFYGKRIEPTLVAKDISILKHDDPPIPIAVEKIANDAPSGLLAETTGTVSSKYAHGFLLSRERSQALLRIGLPTNVTLPYAVGTTVSITGIFISTSDGYRLLVRTADDMVLVPQKKPTKINTLTTSGAPWWQNYTKEIIALPFIVGAVGILYWFRRRRKGNEDLPFEVMDDDDF